MPTPKIQRWVDLLAALLSRAFPVSLETLRAEVPSYGASKSKIRARRNCRGLTRSGASWIGSCWWGRAM